MRWLITGAAGQLGSHLTSLLGTDAVGVSRSEVDITSSDAVTDVVGTVRPDVIVNAAAYTAVDAAETEEEVAYAVNATAVAHLADAARRQGARLLHVSTDYVFDGSADRPYEPDDPTGPRTAYGRTKLAGERFALERGADVIRTAWVYGGPSPNFVDTMLRLAAERDTIDVVDDQTGSPTYVRDLAAALIELGGAGLTPRLRHYANAGTGTWFELARAVFRGAGLDPERVRPTTSDQFVRPAPRPRWSVLSTASWTADGLGAPREWRAALDACLADRAGRAGSAGTG